jgi:hypothetical protein
MSVSRTDGLWWLAMADRWMDVTDVQTIVIIKEVLEKNAAHSSG